MLSFQVIGDDVEKSGILYDGGGHADEDCIVAVTNPDRENGIRPQNEEGEEVEQPIDWFNSAKIIVNPEADSVSLTISTGDPRGAFVWTIRRRPDTGEILLHLPVRKGDASRDYLIEHHEDVDCLHEGTWVISRSRPSESAEKGS